MPADAKFAVYLSHSWRTRDVELNARVWNEVESACELLVDAPETSGADPPYYINRIEEQLRRSDLFLCVLTQRDQQATGAAAEPPLQCSAYSLFEIRLAQRFDIPLLVLYERSTGFKSPRSLRPNERYIAFDRDRSGSLPDERAWRTAIAPKMQEWVRWACDDRKPATYEPSSVAVGLIPPKARDGGAVREQMKDQLRAAGYERVSCKTAFAGNVDPSRRRSRRRRRVGARPGRRRAVRRGARARHPGDSAHSYGRRRRSTAVAARRAPWRVSARSRAVGGSE